ncbi:cytochrome c oxidase accessory protein FixG [Paucibacter oligotrophus]|uniref:Cytochrome c oxidase accessory protein FixG n=1 Tax=Roseateles oligotrophus TaxID=1769250 RepID=A0A840LGN0_9BURK|nr:cytochrome c oxidase accessory protein CcoG [Roseateles oligotrophus]MBB4845378.1 cytochrome c oxidase accessory protein FixG [Roseateles oligotrophus]
MENSAPIPQGSQASDEAAEYKKIWLYQAQSKIYPRSVSGLFSRWRWAMVALTQLLFYGLPWLDWGSRQAVLFELDSRRFYIFGLVLYPQDFIYLTAMLLLSAYALFLFTAVAGRLWCGYTCPQTVYSEIFMWIERRIEGDRAARMRLDQSPWTLEKLGRKAGKQLAWIALGLWTGFTFVGYFTPIRQLAGAVLSLGTGPWETFWVLFYGFATYGNAGYMREQVCKYMCPYARFQSAMFDKDTLIISYDAERGEPRGARGKKVDAKAAGLGSCIDCNLCVQVCPTGIDIRQGLQYECIGCAACVDVCDGVMDKMGYARGLVRYDTQHGLQNHWDRGQLLRRMFRPRVLIYSAILFLISGALLWSLLTRTPFRVNVVRDRAALARQVEDGFIENVYRLQIMNGTEQVQSYALSAEGLDGLRWSGPERMSLAPAEARWVTLSLRIPPESAQAAGTGAKPILIKARMSGSDKQRVEKSTFVVIRP